jgi:hypothetical protein
LPVYFEPIQLTFSVGAVFHSEKIPEDLFLIKVPFSEKIIGPTKRREKSGTKA